jgi:filamentous hemagglutinin family protein
MKTKIFNSCRSQYVTTALVASLVLMHPAASYALSNFDTPTGGVVVGGASTFSKPSAGTLDITQSTDRSVINWGTFNIGADAKTQFFQPSSSSLSVERVTSGNPAQIMGTLTANGNVMILDNNGVLFGRNSVVNVNGIVASTGDVSTAQVMSGASTIQIQNMGAGIVENDGAITAADMGLAALVAPTVRNSGTITANLGKVALGAGDNATVDFYGDGLVSIAVDSHLNQALIANSGNIVAHGGQITMTASAASSIVNNVINNTGIADASSATEQGGVIILSGGNVSSSGTLEAEGTTSGGSINMLGDVKTGNITAKGTLDVSAPDNSSGGGYGGGISLNAEHIQLEGMANAQGADGGGSIWAAGQTVQIAQTGVLTASSTSSGNGGNITLIGSKTGQMEGLLHADGISYGGNITLNSANLALSGTATAKAMQTGPVQPGPPSGIGGNITLKSGTGSSSISGTADAGGNYGGTVDVTGSTVNISGTVHALGTAGIGGLIDFNGGQNTSVSGTVDATGLEGGGTVNIDGGNKVNVSGDVYADPVVVDGQARAPAIPPSAITLDAPTVLFSGLLDANGFQGGNSITLTGGSISSSGDLMANTTLEHSGGYITFSGTVLNNILSGTLSANGVAGPGSSSGGIITIDKPNIVSSSVVVDVSAPSGTAGTYTH